MGLGKTFPYVTYFNNKKKNNNNYNKTLLIYNSEF